MNERHQHIPASSANSFLPEEQRSLLVHPTLNSDIIEEDTQPERAAHGQNVSWLSAYMLIISRMVGSGVFAMPGVVTQTAGSAGMALCVWIMGAIITVCGTVISLEYGCMLPRSGGDKVYLEFTYRRPRWLMSTIIAARAVLQMMTANNCIIFGEYLVYGISPESSDWARKVASLGLLLGCALIHGFFLRLGIQIQNTLGWCKIGLMVLVALTAMITVLYRSTGSSSQLPSDFVVASPQSPGPWEGSNWGFEVLSLALFKVHYAYAGVENANNVLNEIRDPVRMLKRVIPLAILSVCFLYILVNIAFFMVLPLDDLKHSGEMAAALFFRTLFGNRLGGVLMPILIAISVAGNVMVGIFSMPIAQSRLNQEIARQGFLPRIFASSRPCNAPLGGVIVNLVPSACIILMMPSKDTYSFILSAEGYSGQFVSVGLAAGLLWLRRTRPDLPRPFRAWLPLVWFRLGLCVVMALGPFMSPKDEQKPGQPQPWRGAYALVGIAIIATAALYWLTWARILPHWKNYALQEQSGILKDGTTYKKIVHIPRDE
ncbi:amino acid transporter [Penicillium hordei]|uniref:Amino acid transporter n=1 Tax=Penicillium hordei TaxID=40994 RepID=A0AAD6GV31_9EURO|nr:amino acid transporter [Penicillium hordei]KAJ5589139.1 amino acid transporter [Penicillium hordei]